MIRGVRGRAGVLRSESDRGSIPLLMLVILVGTLLAAGIMPVLLNMRTSASFDGSRVRDLNAAQSGVDAVIGRIRNAVDSSGVGEPTQIPCTTNAAGKGHLPITGAVSSADGTDVASYSVLVTYYVSDPIAHANATPMVCIPGAGTYDPNSQSVVPSYAMITSTGTDSTTNAGSASNGRTLKSVYSFKVDNSNISGGTIRAYSANGDTQNFCLDAGSGTPSVGTPITVQVCTSTYPSAAQQTFAYRTDLTLQLVSSIGITVGGTTYRSGLCIDIASKSSTAPSSGSALALQQCGALGSPVWSQQWSFDDFSSLQASNSTTATTGMLSGLWCMTSPVATAGYYYQVHNTGMVTLGSCDSNLVSPSDAWVPSPAVGAGASVADPDSTDTAVQWVNLDQFGRCINDPGDMPSFGFLIAASCKQNPLRSKITTNQFFDYNSSTKQIINVSHGANYCLTSPANTGGAVSKHIIKLTACSSTAASQRWVRTTAKTNPTTPYSQQYRFVDSVGQCMSLAMVTVSGDSSYTNWSKLVTATCDGSPVQQWNAPNNVGAASVQNTAEIPSNGN